jgi:hypothetical protein
VLSDLFARASDLESSGDDLQKEGVQRFRSSLRRFVTMGSPLDKIAFLFGADALRPWTEADRLCFWDHSRFEDVKARIQSGKNNIDWWVNFYHVLDPISGALSNKDVCAGRPPRNFHTSFWRLPGLAHISYWGDTLPLRYILGRIFRRKFLRDKPFRPQKAILLTLYAIVGYFVWAGVIVGAVYLIVKYFWVFVRMVV